jgi:WD40 repeat protein
VRATTPTVLYPTMLYRRRYFRMSNANGCRVFDVHTGSERTVAAKHTIVDAHRSLIYEVAWSPDDSELVTSSADNTVRSRHRDSHT